MANHLTGRAESLLSTSWEDRATIIGFDLTYAAYGIHVTLFILCFSYLWKIRVKRPRFAHIWLAYISVLFILGSIANGIDMYQSQFVFVDNRDFPAGPAAFAILSQTNRLNIVCTAVCIIGGWLQDALLLYRFCVILRPALWLKIVPTTLYVASIAMSCLLLAQLSHPGSTIWARSNINVELAYWSTTIGTNILLTLLIVSHLLQMIYTARKVLGMTQVPYLTVSAILVEGAVLYSSFGLAFLILNALNNPGNVLFFSLLEQLQFITPLLITFRAAQGRAITRENTTRTATTVQRWQPVGPPTVVAFRQPDIGQIEDGDRV